VPKKTKPTTPVTATPVAATPVAKPKVESPLASFQEKPKVSPNAKPIIAQQENVSPRTVKTNVEAPKERVLKEQNGSVKKVGKTPGRERRKEQKLTLLNGLGSGKKSTERKQRNKQLNFNENPSGSANSSSLTSSDTDPMITSPWETSSRVSFRDVLQTKPLPAVDNALNWNPAGSDLASSQLGPIGSRKSCPTQAVTSLWEPLLNPEATVTSNELMNSIFDISQPSPIDMNMDLPALNGNVKSISISIAINEVHSH